MARRPTNAGVTLIELVVVLAIIGMTLVVMAPAVKSAFGVNKRQAAQRMAATIRYAYDESVVRNAPMRIAYDLDNRRWWIEAADGPVRIFRNRNEREAFDEFMEEKKESDAKVAEQSELNRSGMPSMQEIMTNVLGEEMAAQQQESGGGMGMLGGLFGGGGFGAAQRGGEYQVNEFHPLGEEEEELAPQTLPGDMHFYAVWTPQYEDPVKPLTDDERESMQAELPEEQKWTVVYTHIFPGGYMEDTIVYLGDEDSDDLVSIVIEPLTGRVTIVKDEVDPPDLRERDQDR